MSFETLKISELKTIAEDFGVEIDGIKSKKDIITALEEDGVTWSVYQKQNADQDNFEDSEEEPSVAREELKSGNHGNKILVKMTRDNYRYDIAGFTFTKEHPYVAMEESKAQQIFDREAGFRVATPREVQEFYS